jgi:Zn finger protein HypA/HybF involved in hydrogenase expression
LIDEIAFGVGGREVQILECPKCKQKMLKIYTRGNAIVSFLLEDANETAKCRNCGSKIAYSVTKVKREGK